MTKWVVVAVRLLVLGDPISVYVIPLCVMTDEARD